MTQDEIIEMARQAGFILEQPSLDTWCALGNEFEAFAKLVEARTEERTAAKVRKATLEEMIYSHPTTAIKQAVEYEREACAKICDDIRHPWGYSSETSDWSRGTEHCADAIRARGEA